MKEKIVFKMQIDEHFKMKPYFSSSFPFQEKRETKQKQEDKRRKKKDFTLFVFATGFPDEILVESDRINLDLNLKTFSFLFFLIQSLETLHLPDKFFSS